MAERLGHVLYWLGCLAALALAAGAWWVISATGERSIGFIIFVSWPAVLAWLAGVAARYVLVGE
jgi:hypothetical protein